MREQIETAARQMCSAVMKRHAPVISQTWVYDAGVVLRGMEKLWKLMGEEAYFTYSKNSMDYFFKEETFCGFERAEHNLDHINCGKNLLFLWEETGEQRYADAAAYLMSQLDEQPRTAEGAYWHKEIYPDQIWLDGLFMAEPFCARWAALFQEPRRFDGIVRQFELAAAATYDKRTGLYFHACDTGRSMDWADPVTGCSPHVWGRALGWFAMALVDVLDDLPAAHAGRRWMEDLLRSLMASAAQYQDESGVWYQIPDSRRAGNYREASCSCMFAYVLAKGLRKGYLGKELEAAKEKAVRGVWKEFLSLYEGGARLDGICKVAGLGGHQRRDGSFDYYMSEPVVSGDFKGIGPFLLLCAELLEGEKA